MTLDLRWPTAGQLNSRTRGRCSMISNLLQAPLHDPEVFDELSADGVTPRSHWSQFIHSLGELGIDELEKRLARAQRRIRENGVTYNVYGDPQGVSRPWKIDLVPLLIPARRVALYRKRSDSTRRGSEPFAARSLWSAKAARLWPLAGGTGLCQSGLSAAQWLVWVVRNRLTFTCWPWIWRAHQTASGGCLPTAHKRLPALVMRWRTAPLFPIFCPICFVPAMCCA